VLEHTVARDRLAALRGGCRRGRADQQGRRERALVGGVGRVVGADSVRPIRQLLPGMVGVVGFEGVVAGVAERTGIVVRDREVGLGGGQLCVVDVALEGGDAVKRGVSVYLVEVGSILRVALGWVHFCVVVSHPLVLIIVNRMGAGFVVARQVES